MICLLAGNEILSDNRVLEGFSLARRRRTIRCVLGSPSVERLHCNFNLGANPNKRFSKLIRTD